MTFMTFFMYINLEVFYNEQMRCGLLPNKLKIYLLTSHKEC